MSHQSVRFLLRDVANSLADNIQFEAGRESEFNNTKPEGDRFIWLLPLTASRPPRNNPTKIKRWNVAILFMQKDEFDANADQTNIIHDVQDSTIDAFMQRLDDWSQTSKDIIGDITIENENQIPFYKDQAGIYSGWLLRFQVVISDDFIYCTPDNIEIYAGTY